MFVRVELRVRDLAVAGRFYATVLPTLSPAPWGELVLAQADDRHPPTRGLHVGFAAPSRAAVDAFWEAGVRAAHADDGAPGLRPQYVADYYGAFLVDPDGNSAEAVHYGEVRTEGAVDHLWLRVSDLAAARAWYAALAPAAGWRVRDVDPTRVQVEVPGRLGSFALVSDGRPPTQHAHLAVAAADPASAGVRRDPDGNRVDLA